MSDKTVPLQEFVDEHNRLLDQLEAKEREIEKLKINRFFEDYKTERYNRIRITQENKRMRKALEAIAEPKILDIYEACEIARQALKGGD
jgi:hypothetical protein